MKLVAQRRFISWPGFMNKRHAFEFRLMQNDSNDMQVRVDFQFNLRDPNDVIVWPSDKHDLLSDYWQNMKVEHEPHFEGCKERELQLCQLTLPNNTADGWWVRMYRPIRLFGTDHNWVFHGATWKPWPWAHGESMTIFPQRVRRRSNRRLMVTLLTEQL